MSNQTHPSQANPDDHDHIAGGPTDPDHYAKGKKGEIDNPEPAIKPDSGPPHYRGDYMTEDLAKEMDSGDTNDPDNQFLISPNPTVRPNPNPPLYIPKPDTASSVSPDHWPPGGGPNDPDRQPHTKH